MKHSKIIQENLDKRTKKSDKATYFIYAYKEWIIGIFVLLTFIFFFSFSMFNKNQPDLTVRIVSNQYLETKELDQLKKEMKTKLNAPELKIDIQNFLLNDPSQRQVMLAQIAAKQVDLYITPSVEDSNFSTFMNEIIEKKELFKLNSTFSDYVISQSFNAPHIQTVKKLEKAYNNN